MEADCGLTLAPWQRDAVHAWFAAGRRGTIKVVTGAGKTIVALAVAERLQQSDPDLRVAIIVPTIVLMRQWYEVLRQRVNSSCERNWPPGRWLLRRLRGFTADLDRRPGHRPGRPFRTWCGGQAIGSPAVRRRRVSSRRRPRNVSSPAHAPFVRPGPVRHARARRRHTETAGQAAASPTGRANSAGSSTR